MYNAASSRNNFLRGLLAKKNRNIALTRKEQIKHSKDEIIFAGVDEKDAKLIRRLTLDNRHFNKRIAKE